MCPMKPPRSLPSDPAAAREARRSEALRANLRRRKLSDVDTPPVVPVREEDDTTSSEPAG